MSKITDIITDEKIIDLYFNKCMSAKKICEYYNINKHNYRNILQRIRDLGFITDNRHKRKISSLPQKLILDLYTNKNTIRDIERRLNINKHHISEILKLNHIKIRDNKSKNNKKWRGGLVKTSYGYLRVRKPNHKKADLNGYVFEHILIYENEHQVELTKDEVIHHIDFNKCNNNIDNLYKMTRTEHSKMHAKINDLIAELLTRNIIKFENGGYKIVE